MKRIAILLAAAGLGSGCVVDTCRSGDLEVDWSFVNANGVSGLPCNDGSLPATVANVDVYVDGFLEAGFVSCGAGGVVIGTLGSGWHDVIVEGFTVGNSMVARDFFSVEVCGDTVTLAEPGEAFLDIQPGICQLPENTTYLYYQLEDITHGTANATPVAENTPLDGSPTALTCDGGIVFRLPWGFYDLVNLEEIDASDTITYGSRCDATATDLPPFSTTRTYSVGFTDSGLTCYPS